MHPALEHEKRAFGPFQVWYHRQESNLYLRLRRSPFYPLNYGGTGRYCKSGGWAVIQGWERFFWRAFFQS